MSCGAASSSHLVPGMQQDMRLAGGGGEQDCPSVLVTTGKGTPVSSLQGLPDEKDCPVVWF